MIYLPISRILHNGPAHIHTVYTLTNSKSEPTKVSKVTVCLSVCLSLYAYERAPPEKTTNRLTDEMNFAVRCLVQVQNPFSKKMKET